MPKYKLAEYRYGREEMLALYIKDNKVSGKTEPHNKIILVNFSDVKEVIGAKSDKAYYKPQHKMKYIAFNCVDFHLHYKQTHPQK